MANIEKFKDSNFIPDDEFCSAIDDNDKKLKMLKITGDGRLSIIHLYNPNDLDYFLKLLGQTSNKFLKLVYFEYIKQYLSED